MINVQETAQRCLDLQGYIVVARHVTRKRIHPGQSGTINLACGHEAPGDGVDVQIYCVSETTLEDFEAQCRMLNVPAFMPDSNPHNFLFYRMIAE